MISFTGILSNVRTRASMIPALAGLLVSSTVLSGCITETVTPSRGTPIKPAGKSAAAKPKAPAAPSGNAASTAPKAELPKGPVAKPERGRMMATDIRVEVQPLGSVAYDGQALPLVSPQGNLLAVQEGQPPSWEAILAGSGAETPGETRLVVYDITKVPSTKMTYAQPLQAGLILGRSADDQGFLVESPRLDGSRWIGKISWSTGSLTWLVQGDQVNAHGVLSPKGELLFTRRSRSATDADLVLRTASGFESVKHAIDGSYAFPMLVAGSEASFVFRLSRSGTDLEVVRLDRSSDEKPRLADTRQQWRITPSPEPVIAHQMASTQIVIPAGIAASDPTEGDVAVLFDPRKNRMARFNSRSGSVEGLMPQTIGAAPAIGPTMTAGYFCTSAKGLMFIGRPAEGWPVMWPEDGPAARVLASPYIARIIHPAPAAKAQAADTAATIPMYLLVGPFKSDPGRLEITRMAVVPPEPPAAGK